MPDLRVINDALLNAANYEDFHSMKEMVAMYSGLERSIYFGDSVAHSIFVDIKEALGVLSPKQKEAVRLCYMDMLPVRDAAASLGISLDSMQSRLNGAVRKMQKVLLSGELYTCQNPDFHVYNYEGDFYGQC